MSVKSLFIAERGNTMVTEPVVHWWRPFFAFAILQVREDRSSRVWLFFAICASMLWVNCQTDQSDDYRQSSADKRKETNWMPHIRCLDPNTHLRSLLIITILCAIREQYRDLGDYNFWAVTHAALCAQEYVWKQDAGAVRDRHRAA